MRSSYTFERSEDFGSALRSAHIWKKRLWNGLPGFRIKYELIDLNSQFIRKIFEDIVASLSSLTAWSGTTDIMPLFDVLVWGDEVGASLGRFSRS